MPLWLAVVLAVVAVMMVTGAAAYLMNRLNRAPREIASSPATGSSQ